MKNDKDASWTNDYLIDIPEPFMIIHDGRILKCNQLLLDLIGFEQMHTVIGMKLQKLFKDPFVIEQYLQDEMPKNKIEKHRLELIKQDNKIITCDIHIIKQSQQIILIIKNLSKQFSQSEEVKVLHKVLENNSEGVLLMDRALKIVWINVAFENISGYSQEDIIGQSPISLFQIAPEEVKEVKLSIKETGTYKGEISIRQKEGEYKGMFANMFSVEMDDVDKDYLAVICKDMTENKMKEQQIYELVYRDSLTSLYNRAFFMDKIQIELNRAKEKKHKLAVLFFDLDNFKSINDTLGHRIGDFVLKLFGLSLKEAVRDEDVVARLGGDEFVCLIPAIKDVEDVLAITERIMKKFQEPIVIDNNEFYITSSIGISIFPDDTIDPDELMHNADIAMYRAKKDKEKKVIRFERKMREDLDENFKFSNHLRKAIEKDELSLHYQPIVNIQTGELMSAEALLRWNHSIYGNIPPSKFIPIAETNGLILDIGTWVLHEACRQNKIWQQQGFKKIPIAVNISMKQLEDDAFTKKVLNILEATGLEPEYLELEITESISMNNVEKVIKVLEELHLSNIKISIDDFGTGYSSLGKLRKLSINKLKIDRSFIHDLSNGQETEIVSAIIALANNLGLHIIAEGIETKEQLSFLQTKECHYGQGFLFSRPLNQANFEKMLYEHVS